jgi:ribA/ribD-fused uncharacterized protein
MSGTNADLYEVQVRGNFVLFWGGWPSQWYPAGEKSPLPASFIVDGIKYPFAEMWMMAEKARFFGDEKTLAKILKSKYPKAVKDLGREVTPFSASKWDKVSPSIVYEGNLEKFGQNAGLKRLLLATGDKTIVEASPDDTIWGIGMYASDPRATKPSQWLGKNLLGKALMKVRKTLRGA